MAEVNSRTLNHISRVHIAVTIGPKYSIYKTDTAPSTDFVTKPVFIKSIYTKYFLLFGYLHNIISISINKWTDVC